MDIACRRRSHPYHRPEPCFGSRGCERGAQASGCSRERIGMSTRAQVASLAHVPGALPGGHQDVQALALRLCERLSARDFEGANALILAQAAVDFAPAGICGSFSEEGAKFFQDLIATFPDLRLTVHSVVADSEAAAIEITVEGTQGADFLGIHNQDKHIDVDQAWVITAAHVLTTTTCITKSLPNLALIGMDSLGM